MKAIFLEIVSPVALAELVSLALFLATVLVAAAIGAGA